MPKHYKSLDALEHVARLLEEIGKAIAMSGDSDYGRAKRIPGAVGAVGGAAVGGATTYAAMGVAAAEGTVGAAALTSGLATLGGLVGGGMAAGIAVAAAPVTVLAVGGYAIVNHRNQQKLRERERFLFQEALKKQQELIDRLQASSERTEHEKEVLKALLARLKAEIQKMREDLGPDPGANIVPA